MSCVYVRKCLYHSLVIPDHVQLFATHQNVTQMNVFWSQYHKIMFSDEQLMSTIQSIALDFLLSLFLCNEIEQIV